MTNFFFKFLFLFAISSLSSCAVSHYENYETHGAEAFVCESRVIKNLGLNAIKEMEGEQLEPITAGTLEEYEDAIAENDILNIVVYHPTRADLVQSIQNVNERVGGFRVTDGEVYLPCVESVPVINLTLREARESLKEAFNHEVKDVDIFVSYKNRLSHRVELAGLVAISHFPIDGKSRLYEVLAAAHIPPQANLFTSYILRNGHPLDVNLYQLLNKGDMTQNIVMRPGDKVYIGSPQDKSVLVMGEVPIQRPVPVIYGSISLKETLALAGGLPFTANKNCIHIIRGSLNKPKIYTVSWDFMIHQRNEDLLLIPGDLVYVAAKPITNWSRLIGQMKILEKRFG